MATTVKVGALFPLDAQYQPQLRKALDLGIELLNNEQVDYPFQIELVTIPYNNSNMATENIENVATIAMETNEDIVAILGLHSSVVMKTISVLSEILKMPLFGSTPTLSEFADKEQYPFTGTLISSGVDIGDAIVEVMHIGDFWRVAHMSSRNDYGLGLITTLTEGTIEHNIQLLRPVSHTSNVDVNTTMEVIQSIDEALDQLLSQKANVIVYNGWASDAQLVIWRAWKKGMLGTDLSIYIDKTYQWIFSEDICFDAAFSSCPLQECADDMEQMKDILIGVICVKPKFQVDPGWYENVWKPNTTPDKLTDEEIALSGSNDWDGGFMPWSALAFDLAKMAAEVFHNYCLEFDVYQNCLDELPNKGEELMKKVPTTSFIGASGDIMFADNYIRAMEQEAFQWTGSKFESFGTWRPEELRVGNETAFNLEEKILWGNQRGDPLYTMDEGVIKPSFKKVVHFMEYFMFVMTFLALLAFATTPRAKNRRRKQQRGFFTPTLASYVIIMICIQLYCKIKSCLLTISPITDNDTHISVIVEYFGSIPTAWSLGVIISRLYCFYRVTHNKKLKMLKYSKFHQSYTVIGILLIMIPCILIRFFVDLNEVRDGYDIWTEKFQIQDEYGYQFFRLTRPIYKIYSCNVCTSLFMHFIADRLLLVVIFFVVVVLCYMIRHGRVTKKNEKLKREMRSLGYGSGLAMVAGIALCWFSITDKFLRDDAVAGEHIGFDNGRVSVTLEELQMNDVYGLVIALVMWSSIFFACFHALILPRFTAFLQKKFKMGSTSIFTSNGSGAYLSKNFMVKSKRLSKQPQPLSGTMETRLMLNGLETTMAGFDHPEIDNDDSNSEVDSSQKQHSSSGFSSSSASSSSEKSPHVNKYEVSPTTEKITPLTHNGDGVTLLKYPKASNNPQIKNSVLASLFDDGNGEDFRPSEFFSATSGGQQSIGVTAANVLEKNRQFKLHRNKSFRKGNVSSTNSFYEYDRRGFIRELQQLNKTVVGSVVKRMEVERDSCYESYAHLHHKYLQAEKKLQKSLFRLEVFNIRIDRLGLKRSLSTRRVGRNVVRISPVKTGAHLVI